MAAILVFQNNETAAMLVYQENPLGVELFSHVNAFFCSIKLAWRREEENGAEILVVRVTVGDNVVETWYSNWVTSKNKTVHTPPLFAPFKVGVFGVFYR